VLAAALEETALKTVYEMKWAKCEVILLLLLMCCVERQQRMVRMMASTR